MKFASTVLLITLLSLASFTGHASAGVPQGINYQCFLTDADGNPLTGSYTVTFSIYSWFTGGSPLWSQTQTVEVNDGLCNVMLGGNTAPFPGPEGATTLFDESPRMLGVKVGSDPEATPRQLIASVAYALRAQTAEGVVDGGIEQIIGGNAITVINAAGPTTTVHVTDNSIDDGGIRDNSLTASSLAENSVGSSEIAFNAVGTDQLQSSVVFTPAGFVEVSNGDGQVRLRCANNNAGGGYLSVDTDDGDEGVRMNQTTPGHGWFNVNNRHGNQVVTASASTDDAGVLKIRAADGSPLPSNPLLIMSSTTAGHGGMWTFAPDGRQLVAVSHTSGGLVSVFDADGVLSAQLVGATGAVVGRVKSFRMQHPLDTNKEIYYASLEGPEAGVYARGTAKLVNGEARIALPDHFPLVAAEKGITVQLTPLSAESEGLAVVSKSTRGIVIRELRDGRGTYEFDYVVHAVRANYEDFQVVRDKSDIGKAFGPSPAPENVAGLRTAVDQEEF